MCKSKPYYFIATDERVFLTAFRRVGILRRVRGNVVNVDVVSITPREIGTYPCVSSLHTPWARP